MNRLLRENLGLVVTSVLVLATAIRLVSVGGFDQGTLTVLLQTGGVVPVLTSVLLMLTPVAVFVLAILVIESAASAISGPRGLALLGILAVAAAAVPWWTMVLLLPVAFVAFFSARRHGDTDRSFSVYGILAKSWPTNTQLGRERDQHPEGSPKWVALDTRYRAQVKARTTVRQWMLTTHGAMVLVVLLFYLLRGDGWLPAENVVLDEGPPMAAFIVAAEGDWRHLIDLRDRTVRTVRDEAIESRQVCVRPEFAEAPVWRPYSSLAALIQGRPEPSHPVCLGF